MGMYDMINGEQVKVFDVPVGYGKKTWSTGGSLISFNNGDTVPYKTWWYDYTKDFNIIDEVAHGFDKSEPIVLHKIRDGKVSGTVLDWSLVVPSDFDGINLCVTYTGTRLKIKSYEEAERYLKNVEEYREIRTRERAVADRLWKHVSHAMYGAANKTEKEKAGIMILMKKYDKAAEECEDRLRPYYKELLAPFEMEELYQKEYSFGMRLDLLKHNVNLMQTTEGPEYTCRHEETLKHLKSNYESWNEMVAADPKAFESFLSVCEVSKKTVNAILKKAEAYLKNTNEPKADLA